MKSAAPMDVVDEVVAAVEEDEDGGVDEDDIFGGGGHCPRGGLHLARARLTMISAKYRLKEERRKVLKISVAKLKRIDDPESSLRRSVLINNTVRRLQREARDEKMQRQQATTAPAPACHHLLPCHHLLARPAIASAASSPLDAPPAKSPLDPTPDLALSLPDLSDALVDDDALAPRLALPDPACPSPADPAPAPADPASALLLPPEAASPPSPTSCPPSPTYLGFDSMEDDDAPPFPPAATSPDPFSPKGILDDEDEPVPVPSRPPPPACLSDEDKMAEEEREACGALVTCLDELVQVTTGLCRAEEGVGGVEAAVEEEEEEVEEDVHSVLSQFYMPPTPRMLTSIDEEEEEGEAMVLASARQCGLPEPRAARTPRKRAASPGDGLLLFQLEEEEAEEGAKRRRLLGAEEEREGEERVSARVSPGRRPGARPGRPTSDGEADGAQAQTQFSCGHASIFGELQSVVFHSLIASLES
ncbi:translation initiation factor IF-2 [Hetaerina americana]|uniref:translation initiation factor IF-2 n=1 Tax=Hetaerina americana TaxID=62018 RepID=UPI003A7F1739